ncbi:MAG TPA: TolC family protein [Methylophilaceae bacterium]
MCKLYLYLCLMFMAFITPAQADDVALTPVTEPSSNITLTDALNLALNANPEIAVASRERVAIEGARVQAAARPNPTVSALLEDTRNATRQTTILLEQPIELGDKRAIRMLAADARYDAASVSLEVKKSEIQANVTVAFYEVLAAQERLRLAQSSLDVAKQAREAVSKRVQAGKISPVEETKSRVAEASVKIEANRASSILTSARKRLTGLWGNPLPRFQIAEGQVEDIPEAMPLDNLVNMLDSSPNIQRAKLEISTRQALANIENSKRTPDLTVSVGAKRNEELGLNQAVLGVSIPIPVFDRNQGNLQEALSRTDKAKDELTALRIQQETLLAEAYERLTSARQSVETLKLDILPGAQSAFDAATKGFEFGKFGFLDVLDAQRTLVQAKSQYIDALLEANQAMSDIERILGKPINHTELKP